MAGHEHPRPESTSAAVDEQTLEDFLDWRTYSISTCSAPARA
ncbi:hypothetical protein [Micrococcus luteus]